MSETKTCEHCGSDRIYTGPPDCHGCGAPQCCQTCCKMGRIAEERDLWAKELRQISEQLCGVKVENEVTLDMVYIFVEGAIEQQADRAEKALAQVVALEGAVTVKDEALRQAEHALTTVQGLYATDIMPYNPEHVWQLEDAKVLAVIREAQTKEQKST